MSNSNFCQELQIKISTYNDKVKTKAIHDVLKDRNVHL